MGKKFVAAKLVRLTLPFGAFGCCGINTGGRPEARIYTTSGLHVFAVEGEADYEVRELTDEEKVGMENLAADLKQEYDADLKPTLAIVIKHPVILICEEGWELYPHMQYYAVDGNVVTDPERGIAHEMAEIMWRRNDLPGEVAEMTDESRRINIHLSLSVMHAAASSIQPMDAAPPSGAIN